MSTATVNEVRRRFVNELGNRISIVITRNVRDSDLVCTVCRWRGGHRPECKRAGEPWPTLELPNGQTLIRIEGPSSVSQNYLTPTEVSELADALLAFRDAAP